MPRLIKFFVILLVVFLISFPAYGQWEQKLSDSKNAGFRPIKTNVEKQVVYMVEQVENATSITLHAFSLKDGKNLWRTPVNIIPDKIEEYKGNLYVIKDNVEIKAFDSSDGRELWNVAFSGLQTTTATPSYSRYGYRTYNYTVTYSGVKIFFQSNFVFIIKGNNVFAYTYDKGVIEWKYEVPSSESHPSSTNSYTSYVYGIKPREISADENITFIEAEKAVYALNTKTGSLKWRYLDTSMSSPLVYKGNVYLISSPSPSSRVLYCLDGNKGGSLWGSTQIQGERFQLIPYKDYIVMRTYTVSTGAQPATLECYDIQTGKMLWGSTFKGGVGTNDFVGSFFDKDEIYIIHKKSLEKKDLKTGKVLWSTELEADIPLGFTDDKVYCNNWVGKGTNYKRHFTILDKKTGKIMYDLNLPLQFLGIVNNNACFFGIRKEHLGFGRSQFIVTGLDVSGEGIKSLLLTHNLVAFVRKAVLASLVGFALLGIIFFILEGSPPAVRYKHISVDNKFLNPQDYTIRNVSILTIFAGGFRSIFVAFVKSFSLVAICLLLAAVSFGCLPCLSVVFIIGAVIFLIVMVITTLGALFAFITPANQNTPLDAVKSYITALHNIYWIKAYSLVLQPNDSSSREFGNIPFSEFIAYWQNAINVNSKAFDNNNKFKDVQLQNRTDDNVVVLLTMGSFNTLRKNNKWYIVEDTIKPPLPSIPNETGGNNFDDDDF